MDTYGVLMLGLVGIFGVKLRRPRVYDFRLISSCQDDHREPQKVSKVGRE